MVVVVVVVVVLLVVLRSTTSTTSPASTCATSATTSTTTSRTNATSTTCRSTSATSTSHSLQRTHCRGEGGVIRFVKDRLWRGGPSVGVIRGMLIDWCRSLSRICSIIAVILVTTAAVAT